MTKSRGIGRRRGSGIPARGPGWGGDANGGGREFSAEHQPTPEAKREGHAEARTAREQAKLNAVEAAQFLRDLMRDPKAPHMARSDAAKAIIDRAEGRPATQIGGDPNGVPIKTVVTWEGDDDA